jgi:hypothetical protein
MAARTAFIVTEVSVTATGSAPLRGKTSCGQRQTDYHQHHELFHVRLLPPFDSFHRFWGKQPNLLKAIDAPVVVGSKYLINLGNELESARAARPTP